MNFKKNVKKAGLGLLVSAVAIGGAFAWLTNTDTATKQNDIKIGTIKVVFKDGTNSIALTANEAIPMTNEYALENLTPYTFKVANQGEVNVKYNIRLVTEDGSTIDPSLVEVLLNPNGTYTDENGTHYQNNDFLHPWVKLSDVNLIDSVVLDARAETDNVLFARIVESAENADVLGKSVSFHLELDAVQYNGLEFTLTATTMNRIRVVSEEFAHATVDDFTSFKVNGIEYIGTPRFAVVNYRNQVGTDVDMTQADPVYPEPLIEGINTVTFTYRGKEYSKTIDLTPAYKIVSWYDASHNLLKQVKCSMDDVELEVLQDGDISTATKKITVTYNADGSSKLGSSEEAL